ncbi:sensor histidine kinase [Modestobacter sp. I12A-02628]|uniref:Sensor histidine kinase n=1 Tax=Goekera deserti TaxID=2497753 RepID=A0A7K3WIS7_9ACTN|nr:histidine kinase [Goekera deserti]MPQ99335.1 sensor histidine kinase [Goekera deserti]NDI50334.1 sensor histidine kinase [Goekera deserti]NEL56415.1 sensor histidine kinase [Goekera deserti]
MRSRPSSSRAAVPVARLLAAVACLATAVALVLPLLTGGDWLRQLFDTPEPVLAPSFGLVGALLVGVPAARRLGWLLLAVGLSAAAYVLATSWSTATGGATAADWLRSWAWVPAFLLVTTVLPQVLPFGVPLPGRWRLPWAAALALTLVTTAGLALPGGPRTPFAVPGFAPVLAVGVLTALVSLGVRVRRGGPDERRQLGWAGYGVAIAVATTFLAPWWGVALGVLAVPAGLAVAALRYRLYAIDALVARTLAGAVLFGLTALVYAAVAGWAGALLGARSGAAPFVAAFAVALAFQPARTQVERGVERLLYGGRRDPYALLTRLDEALRSAGTPREALREGAAVVAGGLGLAGVAVEAGPPGAVRTREQAGEVDDDAERIPLVLHGEPVGTLLVAGRRRHPADVRLVHDLAGRLAAAAYAERAAAELRDSRERLLEAREEERRRLRRDLHDGLGPQLSAVVMTLDTAASALRRGDGERAGVLVTAASTHAADAVVDVRRLVHGLRPPALDDLGLVGALRAGVPVGAEGGPRVVVEGVGDLDDLPAAVEVAAFRIAQEAVHNAVRHARAGQVLVRVAGRDDDVEVDVVDDGVGLPEQRTAGVGLASMRERAAELGGHCEVTDGSPGTRVRAVLPRQRRS